MFACVRFNYFTGNCEFVVENIFDCWFESIVIADHVRIFFRAQVPFLRKCDCVLSCKRYVMNFKPLRTHHSECLFRNSSGTLLRREIKESLNLIFTHGFYCWKDGWNSLSRTSGSFNEQLFFQSESFVDRNCQFALTGTIVIKWKCKARNRFISVKP